MQRIAHKPRPLKVNSYWIVCGTVAHILSHAGILVILAKLTDATTLGQFAFAIAIAQPIVQITGLNLRTAHATDSKIETPFSYILGMRVITSVIAIILISAIALFTSSSQSAKLVIVLVGVVRVLESLSDILYASLQRREIMAGIGYSRVIRATLSVLFFAAAIAFTGSLIVAIVALIAARIATLCAYDLPHVKRVAALDTPAVHVSEAASEFTPRFDLKPLSRLFLLSLPLGITMFLVGLNINVPRYFLKSIGGEAALGIFAALAYLLTAVSQIASAIGQAAMPRLARFYGAHDLKGYLALLWKLLLVGVVVGVGCGVGAVLIGSDLLRLMYDETYGAHESAFIVIMFSSVFFLAGGFMHIAIAAARAFRVQVPFLASTTAIVAAVSALLISRDGVEGAAWTLVVLGMVQACFRAGILFWLVRRATRNGGQNDIVR